jgi:hypothetical protein
VIPENPTEKMLPPRPPLRTLKCVWDGNKTFRQVIASGVRPCRGFTKGSQAARNGRRPRTGGRSKLEDAAWWVLNHAVDGEPPTEPHRVLQAARKKDELILMRDAVKQLPPTAGTPRRPPTRRRRSVMVWPP